MSLIIDEIRVLTNELRVNQLQAQDQASQRLTYQSSLLKNTTDSHLGIRNLIRTPVQVTREFQGKINNNECSPRSLIHIRASIPENRYFPCQRNCTCDCHALKQANTPRIFHKAVGILFVGYSGYPYLALRRCNFPSCQGQRLIQLSVTYIFPLWFLRKAIDISLISDFSSEVDMALRITRYVPGNADIFRLVIQNDIKGLQRIFSIGIASPNDIGLTGGITALMASQFSYY